MNPIAFVIIGLSFVYGIGSCANSLVKPTTTTTTPTEVIKYLPGPTTVKTIEVPKVILVPASCDFSKKDAEIAALKGSIRELALISRQKGR